MPCQATGCETAIERTRRARGCCDLTPERQHGWRTDAWHALHRRFSRSPNRIELREVLLQPLDGVAPLRCLRCADGVLVAEQADLVECLGHWDCMRPLHGDEVLALLWVVQKFAVIVTLSQDVEGRAERAIRPSSTLSTPLLMLPSSLGQLNQYLIETVTTLSRNACSGTFRSRHPLNCRCGRR